MLELVEGDTLAERLKHGAIPVEESLKLALQIAEALEAAHEKGVIHGDLKPANIKVTPDGKIKVLDFGLAKALTGDGSDVNLSRSPTLSMAATQQGEILGTPAYMSPEQARGQKVDKRADPWAFGCVLFEMLTGRRPFPGNDGTDILAAVIRAEPEWSTLPANLHPRVRELLERCLEKEATNRWQAVGDVRLDIQKVLADPGGVLVAPVADVIHAPPRPILPWIAVAVVLSITGASVAAWNLRPLLISERRPVSRFDYIVPDDQALGTRPGLAISPDGSQFVYATYGGLYLRSMNEREARLVAGSEAAIAYVPFFSPDGQSIGYYQRGELKRIAVSGGAAVTLCDAASVPSGASWGPNGTIVFEQPEGIMRVSDDGGTPEVLVATEEGERFWGAELLPDGTSLLFARTIGTGSDLWDQAQVVVEPVDGGKRKVLVEGGAAGHYVPTGHLTYTFRNVLFARPFDLANLQVVGEPVRIVEDLGRVRRDTKPVSHYAFSNSGSLVYIAGEITAGRGPDSRSLVVADRSGEVELLDLPPARYDSPRLSPDGTQLTVQTSEGDQQVIWVYDLSGRTAKKRLTLEGNNRSPVWTPNGKRIAFASDREGPFSIYWKLADGSGGAEKLTQAEEGTHHEPYSWSPDGRTLSFSVEILGPSSEWDLWTLSLDDEAGPQVLIGGPGAQRHGELSPNGRLIAYTRAVGPLFQVVVEPFPTTGVRYHITTDSGSWPLWSSDGGELFYRRANAEFLRRDGFAIFGVDIIQTEPSLEWGRERMVELQDIPRSRGYRNFDIFPDGERFMTALEAEETEETEDRRRINVVLNWFEELKERVPVP